MATEESELSAEERAFILRTRLIQALQAFTHPISGTRSQLWYLELCSHDTAVMAVHYGQVQAINNVLQVFLAPITSSLSDRFGRRLVMAVSAVLEAAMAAAKASAEASMADAGFAADPSFDEAS